jgi:hypothetical protein
MFGVYCRENEKHWTPFGILVDHPFGILVVCGLRKFGGSEHS